MIDYKIEKEFEVDGFKCVIIGQRMGHRCGYILIPKDHKYYEVDYDEIEVDVHGGWTYSSYAHNNYPAKSEENSWWIGFDCGHYMDKRDIELVKSFGYDNYWLNAVDICDDHSEVRTVEYLENELIEAVKQLMEVR